MTAAPYAPRLSVRKSPDDRAALKGNRTMSNKPTHYLSVITGEADDTQFTRICGVWKKASGVMSFNVPPGVTISGRFVINEAKATDADTGGAQ